MGMKEAYYFSHDYEPTGDPKIQALLGEYGGLGYGVFWRVVEMLHSEETHRLPLKQYVFLAIAKQMLTSAEQIQAMINFAIHTLELFSTDGEFFWSDRVNRNFLRRQEISEKRAVAGRAGAIAKQNLAKPGKGKERKEKEIKEKEIKEKKVADAPFVLPTWIPQETWNSYLAVRKKKRAADTPYALNLVIKELIKIRDVHNHDPVEVLNKSITSGWADVYPLKDSGGQNGTGRGFDKRDKNWHDREVDEAAARANAIYYGKT
jgi:hypothetical protein